MRVFIDFEASSLSCHSYPIEVGWAFEDGRCEAYLIRPEADWTDWADSAQDLHTISRETLLRDGLTTSHVARRMMRALAGHDIRSGAAAWDGKWMGTLLNAAGLSSQALCVADGHAANIAVARTILAGMLEPPHLDEAVGTVITLVKMRCREPVHAHRALADAQQECRRYHAVRMAAGAMVETLRDQANAVRQDRAAVYPAIAE